MSNETYHIPVLLQESIEGLNVLPNGIYTDLTFGGGGHSKAILEKLSSQGKLIAFDKDSNAKQNIIKDKRFTLVREDFRYFKNMLKYINISEVDGVIADLGVSSHHFNTQERGFSFRFDTILDMRMDDDTKLTAADILNTYSKEQLIKIFRNYGDVKGAYRVAQDIINFRAVQPLKRTVDLQQAIQLCIPKHNPSKYLAKLYQALRIELNQEIESLKEMLLKTPSMMKKGGRLVVITYHSIEDKIVKNFINKGTIEGQIKKDLYGNIEKPFKAINKKTIKPTEEEIKKNNRARSAKLRIAEKI